ncbi:FliI/YscN family ATPase [Ferrimonas lipolytica]|uniref:Flagellum-specific ATP synthase n=1 Tax=Ferrimonas lipolytica TaxID=2724191 RepID=A0A6H1UCJ8_9GAMM|nr:FliI/YscN family ATPase [Ferrimonas lipolytica]QIZ76805.1 FliI/YscN family ATPase [Ferrimonas lipolytica]
MTALNSAIDEIQWNDIQLALVYGKLTQVHGLLMQAVGCTLGIGQRCYVETPTGTEIEAEVVGFNKQALQLMPLESVQGLQPGARIRPAVNSLQIPLGDGLLGRVLDGCARPIDGLGKLTNVSYHPARMHSPNPLLRQPIGKQLDVGVRVLNGLLPIGQGQRLGLFAGSGVGKSVLLGMMTRYTEAEIVVVGLIGERGREVREFIEHALGEAGRKQAVVIAAPADATPLMRLRAARLCHQIACGYRDEGKRVLLLMDSLTRYAQAQREIGLSVGEPPATRGYPPSVFSMLPSLVEMAGNGEHPQGSLTAFYTVLAEGDDQQDPIADSARAILDGHMVLSRSLAQQGHYPAVDLGASVSRVADQVVQPEQMAHINRLRHLLGRYREVQELIPLGGYQAGQDHELDRAVKGYPQISEYLQQSQQQAVSIDEAKQQLEQLMSHFGTHGN